MDDGKDKTEVDPWHARRQGDIASHSIRDGSRSTEPHPTFGQPAASARNGSRCPGDPSAGVTLPARSVCPAVRGLRVEVAVPGRIRLLTGQPDSMHSPGRQSLSIGGRKWDCGVPRRRCPKKRGQLGSYHRGPPEPRHEHQAAYSYRVRPRSDQTDLRTRAVAVAAR
jgi:hypothetical protein